MMLQIINTMTEVLLQVRAKPVTPPNIPGSRTSDEGGFIGFLIFDGFTAIFIGLVFAVIFKSFKRLDWEVPNLFLTFSIVFGFVNFFLIPSVFPESMEIDHWFNEHWIIGLISFIITFFALVRLSDVIDQLYHR
jgi:sterol desaturase/sphingolipid hydroxylase (fatty acid hydroxylase superfamily)